MSTEEIINESSDFAIAAFATADAANVAKQTLVGAGVKNVEVSVGEDATKRIDSRAKWFADTDEILQGYKNKLRDGYALLTVDIPDQETRQMVDEAVRGSAEVITHFGQWVTETMKG